MTGWAVQRVKCNGKRVKGRWQFARMLYDENRLVFNNVADLILSRQSAEYGMGVCKMINPDDEFRLVEFESKETP